MDTAKDTHQELLNRNNELLRQLEEANDTIEAIRSGQVDALIVRGEDGHRLYTLKTADQTYRVFIEKMNEGAVTLNRGGIILYSNSRFAAMMNLPLEKVIGLNFNTFIPEISASKFNEVIKRGWDEDFKSEILLANKNFQLTPCLVSCTTLDLDEGTALSLILTDLTSQKEAEWELKVKNEQLLAAQNAAEKLNNELEDTVRERTNDLLISREHFKLLANNIPQMTWTNLPGGEVDFYNQQWYNYTGRRYGETAGWGWQHVVHPDDLPHTMEKYISALKTGNIFEVENRYKKWDDTYRWHLNRAIPLRDDKGEIIFWVGTATDIEDQKKEMDRKDEFIGIASHELKTPLTSLKGYLQLITNYKKEDVPPVVKQYIEKASVAINKLQRLVNDLLDVSKIQAGRLEYAMGEVDLSNLIKLAIENAKHIYPLYDFDNQSTLGLRINGNAERLEQVLMNFVNNAVKYSQVNKQIILKTAVHDHVVRVSVTDFGIGLSEEQLDKIFERFYRVEDKKFMTSGLGMGLYISTEIINNHQGKIGVESELGVGATFYFELPLLS
ncbi:PAS domain-containing sensor histidine kinase [Mucilaginibacter sp. SP1R1]|uniref:PAS domain-containing sensor histidine kinase n=1 Tax=Mucilaginibacter sp. SP1R1 TaxID=2723091 RepID=UPI001608BE01|nr:ATP-binding protein [Mucilaginibacter sp. SP1R1]MBB6151433.1 two-component system CheB/CheR fusion protein [Mucilaginibacter sp. SP1R1]